MRGKEEEDLTLWSNSQGNMGRKTKKNKETKVSQTKNRLKSGKSKTKESQRWLSVAHWILWQGTDLILVDWSSKEFLYSFKEESLQLVRRTWFCCWHMLCLKGNQVPTVFPRGKKYSTSEREILKSITHFSLPAYDRRRLEKNPIAVLLTFIMAGQVIFHKNE